MKSLPDLRSVSSVLLAALVITLNGQVATAQLSQLHPIEYNGSSWSTNFNKSLESSGLVMDMRRFAQIPYNPNASGGLSAPRLSSMKHAPGVDGFFVTDEGLFGADSPESGSIYQVSSDGSNVRKVVDFENLRNLTHEDGADPFGQNRFWNFQGGLRSIAFHPDFNTQGAAGYRKLYTSQIEIPPQFDTPAGNPLPTSSFLGKVPNPNVSGHSVISEWTATINGSDELSLVPSSFREVMRIAPRAGNHPVRQIAFDPFKQSGDADYGLLHILHGDGAEGNNIASGVDLAGDTAFGKLLRVNPLEDTANQEAYSIPTSNPFYTNGNVNDASGEGFLDEVYTHKHRNPHSLAFAQDGQGDSVIFVAEIGRNQAEEINLVPVGGGGNYGWNSGSANREGTIGAQSGDTFVYPVSQYGRSGTSNRKAAVAGGFAIQNGSELDGHYFFADFPTEDPVVKKPILTIPIQDALNVTVVGDPNQLSPITPRTTNMLFDHDNDARTASQQVGSFLDILLQDDTGFNRTDIRFSQGPAGEMYLLNKRNGWIYQVTNTAEQLGSLKLVVDTDSGETVISNGSGTPVELSSYSIFSGNGVLDQASWQSLQANPSFSGWQLDSPSSQVLREANSQGSTTVTGTDIALGSTFAPVIPAFGTPATTPGILRFKYTTDNGDSFNGTVELTGSNFINNLLLTVDPVTGEAQLLNSSTSTIQIRGYSILSVSGSLKPGDGDWNSLSDQSVTGVDEGNVDSGNLSELIPLGEDSLTVAPGEIYNLGDLFTTQAEGGLEDLSLTFVIEDTVFPEGDYNNNGVVNGADFLLWQRSLGSNITLPNEAVTPGVVTQEDLAIWQSNYGNKASGGGQFSIINGIVQYGSLVTALATQVAVPEPSSLVLVLACGLFGAGSRSR